MGLLFALQPEPRRSNPDCLRLRSHFRKFAMGGAFLFVALFIGVMTLAAWPLFSLMRQEGGFWDQIIAGFFPAVLILYPVLALLCFSYEEHVIITKRTGASADGLYDIDKYKSFLIIKWARAHADGFRLQDLTDENWIGAENTASVAAKRAGKQDRYATKGHWMLTVGRDNKKIIIERRARREEIDWLKFLIEKHFIPDAKPAS